MGLWFFSFHPAAKFLGSHISAFLSVKGAGIPVPHDYDSLSRIIDLRGAELEMDPYEGTHSDYLGHVAARHGFSRGDVVSAQEFCIRADETIFVLGTLRENPWADKNVDVHATTLSRIGPGFVSEAEADIQRRSVYEYLDPAAPSGCLQVSAAEFDLHPPVILMKGSPFIPPNRSQREVISDLSWKSVVYIWGGPAVTLLGVWGILKHLQLWGVLP